MIASKIIATQPFEGQKPGTSGLRKKVPEFMKPNYMENFIQCTLIAMESDLKGSTLVVGGDGRFGVYEAAEKIIQMAAANQVKNKRKINCTMSWPIVITIFTQVVRLPVLITTL